MTFKGAGTCVLDAKQAACGAYSVAPQVQQSFKITAATVASTPVLSLRVVGNHLVNSTGQTIRLLGVNRPGMDVLKTPGQCVTNDSVPVELLNDQELVAHPGAKGLDPGVYKSDPGSMWKVPRSDLAQRIFWPTMWTEDG